MAILDGKRGLRLFRRLGYSTMVYYTFRKPPHNFASLSVKIGGLTSPVGKQFKEGHRPAVQGGNEGWGSAYLRRPQRGVT